MRLETFESMVLAIPRRGRIRYNFTEMFAYCLENEKELEELTEEERARFIIQEEVD